MSMLMSMSDPDISDLPSLNPNSHVEEKYELKSNLHDENAKSFVLCMTFVTHDKTKCPAPHVNGKRRAALCLIVSSFSDPGPRVSRKGNVSQHLAYRMAHLAVTMTFITSTARAHDQSFDLISLSSSSGILGLRFLRVLFALCNPRVMTPEQPRKTCSRNALETNQIIWSALTYRSSAPYQLIARLQP